MLLTQLGADGEMIAPTTTIAGRDLDVWMGSGAIRTRAHLVRIAKLQRCTFPISDG
jgi:hypothetical protein